MNKIINLIGITGLKVMAGFIFASFSQPIFHIADTMEPGILKMIAEGTGWTILVTALFFACITLYRDVKKEREKRDQFYDVSMDKLSKNLEQMFTANIELRRKESEEFINQLRNITK